MSLCESQHPVDTWAANLKAAYQTASERRPTNQLLTKQIHTQREEHSPLPSSSAKIIQSDAMPSRLSHFGIKALSREIPHQHKGQLVPINDLSSLSSIVITKHNNTTRSWKEMELGPSNLIASYSLGATANTQGLQATQKAQPTLPQMSYMPNPMINGRPILKAQLDHSLSNIRFVVASRST